MEDRKFNFYAGLTQADYLRDKVQLACFKPIESDWEELFRWIMSISRKVDFYDKYGNKNGCIGDLWYNHVFIVLIEIKQIQLDDKKGLFLKSMDADFQSSVVQGLETVVHEWLDRIKGYLHTQLLTGENQEKNLAVKVAQSVEKQLMHALKNEGGAGQSDQTVRASKDYCNLLKAVSDIKDKGGDYLREIEESGDMDPGLSLLLTFVRNYSTIINGFNQRFTALPEWFYDRICMVSSQKAIQDKACLSITPMDRHNGFYLPALTRFAAGKNVEGTELLYQTEKEEYISGMEIAQVFSVFQKKKEQADSEELTFHKQTIRLDGTSPVLLFPNDENYPEYAFGWMVESEIFVLNEGEATIQVGFLLTADSAVKLSEYHRKTISSKAFSLYASDAQGWRLMTYKIEYKTVDGNAALVFTIEKCKINVPLVAATAELHGSTSEYPVLKILASNEDCPYDWAKQVAFKEVRIHLDVRHIRSVNVCNELGDMDMSKPFHPFGMQAECGSWFRFSNDEMNRKNLTALEISGVWNRLPKSANGFKDIYGKWYGENSKIKIENNSFKIKCERLVRGKWETCTVVNTDSNLFALSDKTVADAASIKLNVPSSCNSSNRDSQPFCITLANPDIGFGSEEYRTVFAQHMVYNSGLAKDKQLPLPIAPLIPVWADMELAYQANAKVDLDNQASLHGSTRLFRVTDLSEYEPQPITDKGVQPFILETDSEPILYLGILNALHKQVVRLYFDLVFKKQNLFVEEQITDDTLPVLEWYYRNNGRWVLLESKYILMDETRGFTQKGGIEIELPGGIDQSSLDSRQLAWLKVHVFGDASQCLSIRRIYPDYVSVVAMNGEGSPLPAMTIKQPVEENTEIKNCIQPLSGYGGRRKESRMRSAVRQTTRIATRNRALTPADYEQLILEHFPEIGKVCCLPVGNKPEYGGSTDPDIHLVVFAYTEDNKYPVTPTWKLEQIKKYISNFISPYAHINITNPIYQTIPITCVASVRKDVSEKGEVMRRIIGNIRKYYSPWIQDGTYPDLGRQYSYKALHNLLANDKDVVEIFELKVNNQTIPDIGVDKQDILLLGKTPWHILIPHEINLKLLLHKGGIGSLMIEYNFKITD